MLTAIPSWFPPVNAINHAGKPIDPALHFFAPPSREIGEITTAHSTLKKTHKIFEWNIIMLISIAAAGAGYGLDLWSIRAVDMPLVANKYVMPLSLAAIAFIICYFIKIRSFKCTYVGKNGAMTASSRDTDDIIRKQELFLFSKAADLRSSLTEMYHNGIYTATQYMFTWFDSTGKIVFKRTGSFNRGSIVKDFSNAYHFLNSTDISWTHYLMQGALEKLSAGGFVHFPMPREGFLSNPAKGVKYAPDGDYAKIYNGYMEFMIQKQLYRYDFAEIEQIRIEKGVICILGYGAKKNMLGNFTENAIMIPSQVLMNMNLFLSLAETGLKLFNPNYNKT